MPRTWHIPGRPVGEPPKGRKSKGPRIAVGVRLRPEYVAMLEAWRAEWGLTQSEAVEQAILAVASPRLSTPPTGLSTY